MNRDEKQKEVEALQAELRKAQSVILSSFEGLTVAQDAELRHRIAQARAKYKVAKNTLIERAARGSATEPIAKSLRGTTSLAYTETDPVALARVLAAYARENPAFAFKAGVVEGRVVSLNDFGLLATLPGREGLFARALSLLSFPAQRVAFAVSGVARNLAYVIQQAVKEKKFQESTGN